MTSFNMGADDLRYWKRKVSVVVSNAERNINMDREAGAEPSLKAG